MTISDDSVWQRPSRCTGWSVRDVLGHLRADEDYFRACLDGRVNEFIGEMGARGATDLDSANQLGVDSYADAPSRALIDEWRTMNAGTRQQFRERDGGDVDTSVGAYSARLQAFHLAQELATHADDIDVPVRDDEEPERSAWRAAVSRFTLVELDKPDVTVEGGGGSTRYRVGDHTGELPDAVFVEAVAARLPADSDMDPDVRAGLSAM